MRAEVARAKAQVELAQNEVERAEGLTQNRTITARDRRMPSGPFACRPAMYTSFMKMPVVLPDPTGPTIQS